ncbi:hypothetical protein JYT20_01265 [Rhodothermus sp. AH-315-K08]|nr:hypothetical protein [Rhodothermus sp. AH-315-K08]
MRLLPIVLLLLAGCDSTTQLTEPDVESAALPDSITYRFTTTADGYQSAEWMDIPNASMLSVRGMPGPVFSRTVPYFEGIKAAGGDVSNGDLKIEVFEDGVWVKGVDLSDKNQLEWQRGGLVWGADEYTLSIQVGQTFADPNANVQVWIDGVELTLDVHPTHGLLTHRLDKTFPAGTQIRIKADPGVLVDLFYEYPTLYPTRPGGGNLVRLLTAETYDQTFAF